MKKYLSGLLAIVIATGSLAFTNPELTGIKQATYEFYYTAPAGSFSDPNVKTHSNWNTSTIGCNGTQGKACNMRVQAAYTKMVGSNRVLRVPADGANVLSIQTGTSGTNYFVTATTGVDNIVNQSN